MKRSVYSIFPAITFGAAPWAIAISCLCLAPKPALAQYVSGSSVSSITKFSPYQHSSDTPHFNNTGANVLIPTTVSSFASLPNGSISNGFVTGSMGTFKAYSFTQYPQDNTISYGNTHANLSALDYIPVTSAVLPFGTPVSLLFTLDVTGTHSIPDHVIGGSYAAQAVAYFFICDTAPSCLHLEYNSRTGASNLLSGTLSTAVGQKLTLQYVLDAVTYVNGYSPFREAKVDYSHTARYFVDSLTDGVVLTSASGHDYSSPRAEPTSVPEPGFGLLTSLVVSSAGFLLQRRQVKANLVG